MWTKAEIKYQLGKNDDPSKFTVEKLNAHNEWEDRPFDQLLVGDVVWLYGPSGSFRINAIPETPPGVCAYFLCTHIVMPWPDFQKAGEA